MHVQFVGGILGVEFGQDAVTRAYLYERVDSLIPPYPLTVAGFTKVISDLGNRLGKEGTKSEGLEVPPSEGAGGKVSGNVHAANNDSIAYARVPRVILRIIYGIRSYPLHPILLLWMEDIQEKML